MATNDDQQGHPEPIDRRRLILGIGLTLLGFVLCLFVAAGTLAWFRGWLFFFVAIAMRIPVAMYLRRVNPEVIAARLNRHEGTKGWDRLIVAFLIPAIISILLLAALDDGRYHWHPVPWWVCGTGYVLLTAGMAGVTWALSVNKFFEMNVRIQTDRGHKVIDTGPYAIVRHPGYAVSCLLFLGMSLALGSLWALIPAVFSCLLLVVRTILEDRTLQAELPGYKEYAQRVRYKLFPGVW